MKECIMKDCFIICPLDAADSPIRKRSDTILKYVLKPILSEKDYNPIRADQIPKAGLITTQVINLIIESPLVIADLTGGNPNVFYELAIRHAARKPYIQIIEKGEILPFDIGGVRTIYIDHTNLDDVEKAKKDILNQIKEIEKGYIPDSPVSIASSVKLLQENEAFAETIAEKIGGLPYGIEYCGYDDYDFMQDLKTDLDRFTSHGLYKFEDLDKKIDSIIELLKDRKQR